MAKSKFTQLERNSGTISARRLAEEQDVDHDDGGNDDSQQE